VNLVSPLSLAILKALIPEYDSVCVDLSPEFNQCFMRWVLKDKIEELHEETYRRDFYPVELLLKGEGDSELYSICHSMADRILSYDPKVVCFSVQLGNIGTSLTVGKILKDEGIKVIFGGSAFLWKSKIYARMFPWIDCVVEGEAEPVFRSLIHKVIKGYKVQRFIISPMLLDLNESPIPDYGDLNLDNYQLIGIETQRGCVNRCSFCNNRFSQLYEVYREKKVERVKRELEILKEYNKPFYFCDNITNPNRKRLISLCKAIAPLGIKWMGEFLPRISFQEAYWLWKSGCFSVTLGVESLCDRTLRKMEKPITVRDILNSIEALSMFGIDIQVNLIIGYPRESLLDFLQTVVRLFRVENKVKRFLFSEFVVPQKSKIYNNPDKYGVKLLSKCENSIFSRAFQLKSEWERRKQKFLLIFMELLFNRESL